MLPSTIEQYKFCNKCSEKVLYCFVLFYPMRLLVFKQFYSSTWRSLIIRDWQDGGGVRCLIRKKNCNQQENYTERWNRGHLLNVIPANITRVFKNESSLDKMKKEPDCCYLKVNKKLYKLFYYINLSIASIIST